MTEHTLASRRRCVEPIGTAWPGFQEHRGWVTGRTENILEWLFD